MSERLVVSKTMAPNTTLSLVRDFKDLGVETSDNILVHTSLSSLGWVAGGEQALVAALIETVESGNLCMPAHTGQNSDPRDWTNPAVPRDWYDVIYDNMPAFDKDKTPTTYMGKVAELFRTWPGTKRSNHPQVSFSVFGKDADSIIENHPLTPQMGMESPLGKLYNINAKVLLIGVSYEICSALHLSEATWGKMPSVNMGTALFEEGERIWRWFDDFDYDANDFAAIGRAFENEKKSLITEKTIGMSRCRLLPMRELVDFGIDWMDKHR